MSNSKDKSPDFYEYYPKLFQDYFPEIGDEIVEVLSKAGYDYYLSIVNLDSIIDDGQIQKIFRVLDLQENTIKFLSSLYQPIHQFWLFWNQRKTEYFEAISLERKLLRHPIKEKYHEVADKKSAFGKVAIDALYCLSQEKDNNIYQTLLVSHKYFSIAFQMYDDVLDFSEDFHKKQFNWAVYHLSQTVDFSKYNNDVEVLNKLLYIEDVGIEILNQSIFYLDKAKENVLELCNTETLWVKTITDFKNNIVRHRDITLGYIKTVRERTILKKLHINDDYFFDFQKNDNDVIVKGLNFIKSDFLKNYAELKHIMFLGALDDFDNETDIHSSDTFQRALLNDCLISIAKKLNINIELYTQNETKYLLQRQNDDQVGAWSYFPTVKEIAADIDDLGQIMQFFIHTHQSDLIDKYCQKAIDIAINERVTASGGIETWILPQKNLTENQKKQDFFNTTKWGKGPDIEVVANFVYGLALFDSEKYRKTIDNAIKYIIVNQKEDGYWESRWYYSKYYGTFVCLKLLSLFPNQYMLEKEKIKKFIVSSQNDNGSFDEEKYQNLSTSFAIHCINLLQFDDLHNIKLNAQKFLIANQCSNGSWKAEDFIKPKAYEPYKSKTITTAYVLNALL